MTAARGLKARFSAALQGFSNFSAACEDVKRFLNELTAKARRDENQRSSSAGSTAHSRDNSGLPLNLLAGAPLPS
jgi:hypothetical protein